MKNILLGLLIFGVLGANHVSSLQAQSTAEYYAYIAVNQDDYSAQIHFVNPLNLNQDLPIIELPISENESLYDAHLSPTAEWVLLLIDPYINNPDRRNWGGYILRLFNPETQETLDVAHDIWLTESPESLTAGRDQNFAWSLNGRFFAFTWTKDSANEVFIQTGVYLYDLQKRQITDLTPPTATHYWLSWSNDSSKLAIYESSYTQSGKIRQAIDIFEAATTTLTYSIEVFSFDGDLDLVDNNPNSICDLRWSDDNRYLSFIQTCERTVIGGRREVSFIDFETVTLLEATHLTPSNVFPQNSTFHALIESSWISNHEILIGIEKSEGEFQLDKDGILLDSSVGPFTLQTLIFDATTGQTQEIDATRRGFWNPASSELIAYFRYIYPEGLDPNESASPIDGSVEIAAFDGQSFQVLASGPSGCNFAWNSSATMLAYTEQEYPMVAGFCYPRTEVFHFLDVTTGASISYTSAQESVYRLGWLSLQE